MISYITELQIGGGICTIKQQHAKTVPSRVTG